MKEKEKKTCIHVHVVFTIDAESYTTNKSMYIDHSIYTV